MSDPSPLALPARPHLNWLKNRAKEKLEQLRAVNPASQLAEAQFAIAREYGFPSWQKLKDRVALLTFQAALDDSDAPAMATLLAENPSLSRTRKATWTHPSGDRRIMPALFTAACMRKNLEMVRSLVDAGANANDPAIYPDGRPGIMEFLLDRGMKPDAITFPENCTGLMFAAYIDDADNARLLISRHADSNIALKNCGIRALHWLPWRAEVKDPVKTVAIARLLVDAGADVNARIFTGLDDEPITDQGNLYLVEHGGSTVVHTAAMNGMVELIRFLLDAGADVNTRTTSFLVEQVNTGMKRWRYQRRDPGLTPLHLAIEADDTSFTARHVEVARLLLEYGADIEARGEAGNIGVCTPLHLACFSGADRAPVVRLLLDRGANPNVTSSENTTPLFDAARHGEIDICNALLDAGATASIFEAVALNRRDLVEHILKDDPEAASRPHPYTHVGPIANARSTEMRDFLVSRGARPTIHEAAELGWIEQARLLLDADPSLVQSRSGKGQTPLHHAIDWNQTAMAEFLIARGADLCARWAPRPGWTPLELAARRNHPEIIQLIESRLNSATAAPASGDASTESR